MPKEAIPEVEEAIRTIESLHSNMAVLSRLDSILRDYNANLADAEQLLLSDAALSAAVIKISNSVLYRRGPANSNLHSSIQQVGFNQILKLVGMALSKQVFMKDLDAYGISAERYWFNSYFCALFLESNARRFHQPHEDAYLVGLLHDIGKVVINELLRDHNVEIFWDPSIPAESWENVMVGFTYSRAGSILLDNWNFPARICRLIESQTSATAIHEEPILCMLDFARNLLDCNPIDQPLEQWNLNDSHPYRTKYASEAAPLSAQIGTLLATITQVRQTLKHL
jgi:HD-like signal output (HDOD) protein